MMFRFLLALAVAAAPSAPPSPTPTPPCYRDVTVVTSSPADYPGTATMMGSAPVEVLVRVVVEADGRVSSASIYKSSADLAMDQAALRAAIKSTYAPKMIACKAVRGVYFFNATFQP